MFIVVSFEKNLNGCKKEEILISLMAKGEVGAQKLSATVTLMSMLAGETCICKIMLDEKLKT